MKRIAIFIILTLLIGASIFLVGPMIIKGAPPAKMIAAVIMTGIIYLASVLYKKFFQDLFKKKKEE
jgi:hypothetical protein